MVVYTISFFEKDQRQIFAVGISSCNNLPYRFINFYILNIIYNNSFMHLKRIVQTVHPHTLAFIAFQPPESSLPCCVSPGGF